ncbi:MAG: MFS transporter [Pseudomonadota bacterium]
MIANRNLAVLVIAQCVTAVGSIVLVTLGGILGQSLAPHPQWATLPLSLMVLGTATSTVPAAAVMARVGRRRGFVGAGVMGIGGVLLVSLSLINRQFTWLCAGTFLYGIQLAFMQQYRFAAAESVLREKAGRAISCVLLSSIGGAALGPVLVNTGRDGFGDIPFVGTMIGVAALMAVGVVALLCFKNTTNHVRSPAASTVRPLGVIARQRHYVVAVLCAASGYGVMVFVMTATPLSMHVHDGFSMGDTSTVIRNHVIAMYAPSLISAVLMERLGVRRVMFVGAVLLGLTLVVGLLDRSLIRYQVALILLGVGWNFLYVGGTTLVTRTYEPEERFRAQGLNDLCVFSTAALASLLSGQVMAGLGWSAVMIGAMFPLLLAVLALQSLRSATVRVH